MPFYERISAVVSITLIGMAVFFVLDFRWTVLVKTLIRCGIAGMLFALFNTVASKGVRVLSFIRIGVERGIEAEFLNRDPLYASFIAVLRFFMEFVAEFLQVGNYLG